MALTSGYTQQPAATSESLDREQLILAHLSQVHYIASRIHERLPQHIALDDLVSAGVLGLISAIDNFDGSRNVKLRTYAEHKIRGYILNSIGKISGTSRQSVKLRRDIQQAISSSERKSGRTASAEEVAAELGVPLEEYHAMLLELQATSLGSLESLDPENPDSSGFRYIADKGSETPEQIFEGEALRALLVKSLDNLPENERIVLSLYYQEGLNLREIAQVLDLHITRISQIKTQAILRLRAHLEQLWPGRVEI